MAKYLTNTDALMVRRVRVWNVKTVFNEYSDWNEVATEIRATCPNIETVKVCGDDGSITICFSKYARLRATCGENIVYRYDTGKIEVLSEENFLGGFI
jgi:hypothetical protein